VRAAVVLFTRDLRVRDNPALAAAAREAGRIVPLFVRDPAVWDPAGPNRVGFLLESLDDLARSLGGLLVERGDPSTVVPRVVRRFGAEAVFASRDASAYAQRRERRLAETCDLRLSDGVTAVPLDALAAQGSDHFRVFTPYWRRWRDQPLGSVVRAPRVRLADGVDRPELPSPPRVRSPEVARGGEAAGRAALERWLRRIAGYGEGGLGRRTSRLSPYLHFGCVSARGCAVRARGREGAEPWLRELCWRDFFAQLLRANPETASRDLHPKRRHWRDDPEGLAAWREGRTGFPLVDAGMRQLARDGWMHNRARLVAASFLVHDLGIDWREGARVFEELLVDGDIASNRGNWQWVAGTGVDTRPGRTFSPTRQAARRDPGGAYIRRHVAELDGLEAPFVHEPWRLGSAELRRRGYPERIVERA
jgi:deoxyribodipyrimidine photo-lyase